MSNRQDNNEEGIEINQNWFMVNFRSHRFLILWNKIKYFYKAELEESIKWYAAESSIIVNN